MLEPWARLLKPLKLVSEKGLNIKSTFSQCVSLPDDRNQKTLDWYSVVDPSSNHLAACGKREPATGDWFFKRAEYIDWLSLSNSFLWVHGIPGCGKTVLRYLFDWSLL